VDFVFCICQCSSLYPPSLREICEGLEELLYLYGESLLRGTVTELLYRYIIVTQTLAFDGIVVFSCAVYSIMIKLDSSSVGG